MAIYFNLAIDCGHDQAYASTLVDFFQGRSIAIPNLPPAICRSWVECQRGLFFVAVEPIGMGYATHPAADARPELVTDEIEATIRADLYEAIKSHLGFRRAMFGAECFDQLAYADPEEDADIDYGQMISSISHFPTLPENCIAEPFLPGYRLVLQRLS